MSNESAIANLLRGLDKSDPTTYMALQLLLKDFYDAYYTLFPPSSRGGTTQNLVSGTPDTITDLTAVAFPSNLRIKWTLVSGGFRYEVRLGSDWDTATPIVTTSANVVNLDPVELGLVYGTYTFLVRPISISNVYGNITSVDFTVSSIDAPDLTLNTISNYVLLKWTAPTSSWAIKEYIVYRNSAEIGRITGTFKLVQELVGGAYSYNIAAVDIVGNISLLSATRVANLTEPDAFEFVDTLDADFTGTYSNAQMVTEAGLEGIIGAVDPVDWATHFSGMGWANIDDAIAAGYTLYFQPSLSSGYYEEIFDFGAISTDLTIVVSFSKLQYGNATAVTTDISYSDDNITYSSPVTNNVVLGTSFRYVKVRWNFASSDDLSAAFIYNLNVTLNVALNMDSGTADAFAADSSGTEIEFNRTFKRVNSVTVTPTISTQPLYFVTDNITETSFFVYVFDSSGNRVDATVTWKARGVV